MVLANGTAAPDGTPLADAYLPPASFYAYLDQFTADSTIGTRLSSNFRWVQTNAGNLSASEAAQGVSATQMRAYYVYMNKAEEQVACMRELRTSVESAGVGTGTESYPFMFVYIFYEQFAIIR